MFPFTSHRIGFTFRNGHLSKNSLVIDWDHLIDTAKMSLCDFAYI
jgi:hypothetical protein